MTFPVIRTEYPLILASASPRRKRLLQQICLPFTSLPSQVDETRMKGEASHCAHLIAEKKARAVYSKSNGNWILGADTMVIVEKEILGKPRDRDEARFMLSLLSGKEHKVTTGFCILNPLGQVAHSEETITLVRMKPLSTGEIKAYVNTGEPFDKAGGYAIQGVGSFMVEAIKGSYTNVVGLPICSLVKALLAIGGLHSFPLPFADELSPTE